MHSIKSRAAKSAASCLLALACACLAGAATFNGFTVAPAYPVSSSARSAVFADFNGDGKPDIAVVGPGSNALTVLLGNGDGTFQPALNITLPYLSPVALVAGHFKSTTLVDLAVAYSGSNNVTILAGNGNGTFGVPNCVSNASLCPAVGSAPSALVALTLLQSSAYQDLAVANAGSNSITLLQNKRNGSGAFSVAKCSAATGSTCSVGTDPVSLVAADFNGDGKVDLAVANAGSNTVSLLLNSGSLNNGVFQSALTYGIGTGTQPGFLATADLDANGLADLVAVNRRGGTNNSGNLAVLLNTGNDSSGHPVFATANYGAGPYPQAVALADLNGDGALDATVADGGGNQAEVLLNSGNGTFSGSAAYSVGGLPDGVVAADVNADGKPDLAVLNANDGTISILLNSGNGAFSAAGSYAAGTTPVSVAEADFDGDGNLDVAVANIGSNNATVALGDGAGHLGSPSAFAVASGSAAARPVSVAAADFNRDGKADLVVVNQGSNSVGVLLNNSVGVGQVSFRSAVTYAVGASPTSVAVGDFNRDGKLDLAVTNGAGASVSVLLGNGDGTFQSAVSYAVGTNPYCVRAGDFNGDGKLDLAVANAGSNSIGVLLGNGNGTFQTMLSTTVGETPVALATGDFNSDGKADLVVANYNDNNVWLLLGNGNGTFYKPTTFKFTTDSTPSSVLAADFNSDGAPDLIVANSAGNDVTIFLGTGAGGFEAPISCPAGDNPFSMAAGRFTGSANPLDVAIADQASNGVTLLIQPATLPAAPTCN